MDSRQLKTEVIDQNPPLATFLMHGSSVFYVIILKILTALELITVPRSGAWYTTPAMM